MERIFDNTFWKMDFSSKAAKQARKLPDDILSHLYALKLDLVTTAWSLAERMYIIAI